MSAQSGWSLPLTWFLVIFVALLVWAFGWLVLPGLVVLFALITACVWLHDIIVHDKKCRWCNVIKDMLETDRGIDRERVRTKHVGRHPTHLHVRVLVDGEPDCVIDIDFNGFILQTLPPDSP